MRCPENLILSISAAAISVAEGLTEEDLELLSAIVTQFADTLTTLAVIRGQSQDESKQDDSKQGESKQSKSNQKN